VWQPEDVVPQPAAPATHSWTFAMVDLAGYTALTEVHGDDQGADLAVLFAHLARTALGPRDRLVKPIGDAVLLASPDPAAGLGLVERLLSSCSELEGFPLVRAGLHHGPAAERDGDMFGTAVNTAARIAGQASGGQVLATEAVAATAMTLGLPTVSIGSVELRNLAAPLELFAIELGPQRLAEAIDPVCRMSVDRRNAAGRLRHEGHDRWFCSLECAALFAANPGAYAAP